MEDSAPSPGQPRERSGTVHVVVAAGGAIGAVARYGMAVWLPTDEAAFPWATLWTNVIGCLAIGILMVLLTEGPRTPYPLARPFLGVGILGGFTTFSTFAVEIDTLLSGDAAGAAIAYLFSTLAGALLAIEIGVTATRRATRR